MPDYKKIVRKGVLTNRRLLSEEFLERANRSITDGVISLIKELSVRSVHIFLPIEKNNEPNTWPLLNRLFDLGISTYTSKTDFKTETMTHFLVNSRTLYVDSRFGIPEPKNAYETALNEVEMIVVPLLAADKKGNRIGYGKGYYDRLLAEIEQPIFKVGLNLGALFDDFKFGEAHDIQLDYCVIPGQIIRMNAED